MSLARRRIHALRVRSNRLRDTYIPRATEEANVPMLDFYNAEYAALEWAIDLLTNSRPSTTGAIITALRAGRDTGRWDGRSLTGAAACLQRSNIVWDDFACGVASAVIEGHDAAV